MRKFFKVFLPIVSAVMVLSVAFTGAYLFSDWFTSPQKQAEAGAGYSSGSTGEAVRQIQTALQKKGYYTAAIDGIFGKKTTAAVKRF